MKYYISVVIVILILYLILSNYNYNYNYSGQSKCSECEGFTTNIRQAFRPYFRDTKNRVNRFLRNIGLF
jgi:hypothetical protein